MAEYSQEKTGILFKNDTQGNDSRPWYKGNCEIDGQKYEIAAWVKESKAGNKFLSLKFQLPREQQPDTTPPDPHPGTNMEDIPF